MEPWWNVMWQNTLESTFSLRHVLSGPYKASGLPFTKHLLRDGLWRQTHFSGHHQLVPLCPHLQGKNDWLFQRCHHVLSFWLIALAIQALTTHGQSVRYVLESHPVSHAFGTQSHWHLSPSLPPSLLTKLSCLTTYWNHLSFKGLFSFKLRFCNDKHTLRSPHKKFRKS